MSAILQRELSHLSASEKLLLVEDVWDEIAQNPSIQSFAIPQSQMQELDRRYQEFLANPEEGSSWEEVRDRLISR